MNDKVHIQEIFAPSGCLTLPGMRAHLNGSLSEEMDDKVISHLLECELCSEALGGVEIVSDDAAIEQSVAAIVSGIQGKIDPAPVNQIPSNTFPMFAGAAAAAILILFAFFFSWKVESGKMDRVFSDNFEPLPAPTESVEKPKVKEDAKPVGDEGPIAEANVKEQEAYKWTEDRTDVESRTHGSGLMAEKDLEEKLESYSEIVEDYNGNAVTAIVEEAPEEEEMVVTVEDAVESQDYDGFAAMEEPDFDMDEMLDDADDMVKAPAVPKEEVAVATLGDAETGTKDENKALPYSNSGYNMFTQKEKAKAVQPTTGFRPTDGKVTSTDMNGLGSTITLDDEITQGLLKNSTDSIVVTEPDSAMIANFNYTIANVEQDKMNAVEPKWGVESDAYRFSLNEREVDGLPTSANYPREEFKSGRNTYEPLNTKEKKQAVRRRQGGTAYADQDPRPNTAMDLYESGQYAQAARAFEKEILEDPNNELARLYGGISYLESEDPNKALEHLDYLIAMPGSRYKSDAKWYRSLALIKLRRSIEAEEELEELERESQPYKMRANKALDQLRK